MHTRHLVALIIVIALLVGAAWYIPRPDAPIEAPESTQAMNVTATQVLTEIAPAETLEIPAGTTALAFLMKGAQQDGIAVTTKTYTGLGTMVEKIGTLQNGTDDKYWQYYVNGTLAPVGADVYEVQNGDVIEWRFAAPDMSY